MTPSEFKAELKKLSGGYLFYGEEDYLKRYYLNALRKQTVTEGDVFNHIVINSESYTPERLSASLEALPVMADRKLVEVNSLYLSSMSENELEELCSVLARLPDYEYNVLVIYTEPDELDPGVKNKPSPSLKKLTEYLKPVFFDRETPARLADWTYKHFVKELIVAPHDAVTTLVSRCGGDMYTLSGEIDKLCCYLKANGRDKLTEEDVVRICGERKEIGAFELANAILDRSPARAFAVLSEMKKVKERPEAILSGISRTISDLLTVKVLIDSGMSMQTIEKRLVMNSYRLSLYSKSAAKNSHSDLKNVLDRCYEADKLIKSTQLNSYTVLERLAIEASRR